MNAPKNLMEDAICERYPNQKMPLERMFKSINKLPPEDRAIVLRVMRRYDEESEKDSYKTDPGALVKFMADERLIEGSNGLVDLGAGPGDLLYELAPVYPDTRMVGLDLSPGFVENFNRKNKLKNLGFYGLVERFRYKFPNAFMDAALIDSPFEDNDFASGKNGSVISVLTLDRLTNPRVLIENMARFTRAKILGTLLPVVPEDDNPSRQSEDVKIVYTRPQNRIVPGRTASEDREELLRVLKDIWQKPVDVENVPYGVASSSDRQEYDLAVFYARGCAR